MKRSGKIVLGVVGALALLGVVAVILVVTFDWNRAKPWVAETVGHAIGRSIAIDGDLRVSWQRDPELRGWRAWLPGPRVSASGVTVGNTDWAKQREFATLESVELDLAVFPLLMHTLSIPSLRFVAPNVDLERLADGRDNWTFTTGGPSRWKFDPGRILFDRGQFSLSDHLRGTELKVHVDALEKSIPFDDLVVQQEDASRRDAAAHVGASAAKKFRERAQKRTQPLQHSRELPQQYAFSWSAQGTFHGAALKGTGRIGSVLALKHAERPFPLQADVRIGETRITLIGTLTDPTDLDALDLRLWLSGSSLAQLYDILHIPLPDSRPYVTEGHLIGRFAADEKRLRYENFTARVGESDLNGDLVYETRKPRPLLSGKVQSELLQFRDLALMIGADTSESKPVRGGASPQPTGKVLPTKPFRPERWRVMDTDVQFTGDRVFRDSELPIHKVDARIVMDDAVLSLKPLRFRYAYGDVNAAMRFDGQNAPIKSTLQLSARGVQLKYLFPSAEAMKTSLGEANGEANLSVPVVPSARCSARRTAKSRC